MSDLKKFRAQYNFSQSFLAVCLKIPKSQLSMAELKLRNLPREASENFTWLERQMLPAAESKLAEEHSSESAALHIEETLALADFLRNEVIEYKYRITHSRKNLLGLTEHRQKALATVSLTKIIRQQSTGTETCAPPQQWTSMAETRAQADLKNITTSKILLLELKITGLEAQLATAEKKINALERSLEVAVEPQGATIIESESDLTLEVINSSEESAGTPATHAVSRLNVPIVKKNNLEGSKKYNVAVRPFLPHQKGGDHINEASAIIVNSSSRNLNQCYPDHPSILTTMRSNECPETNAVFVINRLQLPTYIQTG